MSEEELAQAWAAYVQTHDPDILELLVIHYEPLARYLARRAIAKAPAHQDAEDLISYAHHGLLDAIGRFEPERGLKFETYATRRITGAILDGQRSDDPLTRSARKRVKTLAAAREAIWNREGRAPTNEELASATGESESQVRELLVMQQTLTTSLFEPARGDDTPSESRVAGLVQESEAEIDAHLREIRDSIAALLSRLGERDRIFVILHYCKQMNFRQIGEVLGVTESRCGQIRAELLRSIRAT